MTEILGIFDSQQRSEPQRHDLPLIRVPRGNGQARGGGEVEEGIDDVEKALLLDQNPITERLCAAALRRFRGANSRYEAPNPAAAS